MTLGKPLRPSLSPKPSTCALPVVARPDDLFLIVGAANSSSGRSTGFLDRDRAVGSSMRFAIANDS